MFFEFSPIISEHKRKEAIAASNELTQALVDHLNVGYDESFSRLLLLNITSWTFAFILWQIVLLKHIWIKKDWMQKQNSYTQVRIVLRSRHNNGWVWSKDSVVRWRLIEIILETSSISFSNLLNLFNFLILGNWRCWKLGKKHWKWHGLD